MIYQTIDTTSPLRRAHRRGFLKRSFLRDERGLSSVEYVILLAVVVVGCVGFWNRIGSKFLESLTQAQSQLDELE